jgi:prepilin-type N-terminal cleavage/methylation domain-containing protein
VTGIQIETSVGPVLVERHPAGSDYANVRSAGRLARLSFGLIERRARGSWLAIPSDGREPHVAGSGREAARWLAEGHHPDGLGAEAAAGGYHQRLRALIGAAARRVRGRVAAVRGDDAGFTLVEIIVSMVMILIVAAAAGRVLVSDFEGQRAIERDDPAVSLAGAILAAGSNTDYANLGYYENDSGFTPGSVTLPLNDATGNPLVEPQIDLGSIRPAGQTVFSPTTVDETYQGQPFHAQVWVTKTADGSKRITVAGKWPSTGVCGDANVSCSTQTVTRAPWSADQTPSGTAAPPACSSTLAAICQTYVRSGRVLDGEPFATLTSYPRQSEDVLLQVRTTAPATAVSATWTWVGLDGSTKVVTIPSADVAFTQVESDPTRWAATIPADPDDPGSANPASFRDWIRPGTVTVTFTATINGVKVVSSRDADWTYRSAIPVTAKLVTAGTCSALGAGQPATISVSGLSMGYGTTPASQSAADTVSVDYTVVASGQTKVVSVPATLVAATPQYVTSGGQMVAGHVDAQFTVTSPADQACPAVSPTAGVEVHRAIDGTTTTIPLPLLPAGGSRAGGPMAPAGLTITTTGATPVLAWAPVTGATSYAVAWTVAGGSATTTTTTGTTITVPTTPPADGLVQMAVSAIDSQGRFSMASTAQAHWPMPKPTGLHVVVSSPGSITLGWDSYTAVNSVTYAVWQGSGWKVVGLTATTFTITGTSGTTVGVAVGVVAKATSDSSTGGLMNVTFP